MAEFAYIKFLKSEGEGEAKTRKVHVSQIHKFHEIQCTSFQTYKVEVEPGIIKHATVLFVADSENELDTIIKKQNRIRQPNEKYITAPVDTTDSETDSKNIIKKPVKTSVLSARMESLKRKQESQYLPPPASSKIPKIIETKIQKSPENVVEASTTKETSKCDKKRIPLKVIHNNMQVSNSSSISTLPVKSEKEKNNVKIKFAKRKSSGKIQRSSSVTPEVDATGGQIDIKTSSEETDVNVVNPQINLKKFNPTNKKSPTIENTNSAQENLPTTGNVTSGSEKSPTIGSATSNLSEINTSIIASKNKNIRPNEKKSASEKGKVSNNPATSAPLVKVTKKKENVKRKISTGKSSEKIQNVNSVAQAVNTKVDVSAKEKVIKANGEETTAKNMKNPQITGQKSTSIGKNSQTNEASSISLITTIPKEQEIVYRNYPENQSDQHMNIDLKAKEPNFMNLMNDRREKRGAQNLVKEEDKITKLSDSLKKKRKLLKDQRVENEKLNEIIISLKGKLQLVKKKLVEAESNSSRIQQLNEKWQALSMNKCAALNDMFAQITNRQDFRPEEIQLQPGYISEDKRFIHMGRGEWISYATYLLSMNGVTYKSRKTFPRNLCVGVFGYDLLRKSTVTGQGSNRNGNVKKPEEKLDPNKVLAIKDLYKYFLVNELHVNVDDAEFESCQVNKIISKKIALVKELYKKTKTNARPLLGDNLEQSFDEQIQSLQEEMLDEKEGDEDNEEQRDESEDNDDEDKEEVDYDDDDDDGDEEGEDDDSEVDDDGGEEEEKIENQESVDDNDNNGENEELKEVKAKEDEYDDDQTDDREIEDDYETDEEKEENDYDDDETDEGEDDEEDDYDDVDDKNERDEENSKEDADVEY